LKIVFVQLTNDRQKAPRVSNEGHPLGSGHVREGSGLLGDERRRIPQFHFLHPDGDAAAAALEDGRGGRRAFAGHQQAECVRRQHRCTMIRPTMWIARRLRQREPGKEVEECFGRMERSVHAAAPALAPLVICTHAALTKRAPRTYIGAMQQTACALS
jgi:hypothetical protein